MKTIDELQKEYDEFEIENKQVDSLLEFIAFIEFGIDDTYDIEKSTKKEIRLNKIWQLESKIRNYLLYLLNGEEINIYEEDSKILYDQIKLAVEYRDIMSRMLEIATEDNYKDLLKLIDFACTYYDKHIDFFEYERDILEFELKGIYMSNSKYEDNRSVVSQFIEQKLLSIRPNEETHEKQYRKVIKNA